MGKQNVENSLLQARAIVRSLVESGVSCLVASPGFRNSTLVLAAREQVGLSVVTAVDERAAAFYALGWSKTQERPAAVLCTSGTAVANYFPAIIEAYYDFVPLVVITADRPSDLVGLGANQCADQNGIFGKFVRSFYEVQPPDPGVLFVEHARYVVGKSVALARGPVPGPVHVNVRFREPFYPGKDDVAAEAGENRWTFSSAEQVASAELLKQVEDVVRSARRPMFYFGPSEQVARSFLFPDGAKDVLAVAEPSSGMAFRGDGFSGLVHRSEAILSAVCEGRLPAPDLVIRVGPAATGRGLGKLLKAFSPKQIVIDSGMAYRNPELYPSVMIDGSFRDWSKKFRDWYRPAAFDYTWRESMLRLDAEIDRALEEHLDTDVLTEWSFHRKLERIFNDGDHVFLGNSMPIRDFNSVFARSAKRLRVFANRGQSGIDGLLATALGVACAGERQTHLIIGDLSLLHDLSSFSLAAAHKDTVSLRVWLMNNGGGEIFKVVPTGKGAGKEEWFTTPQKYDASAVAKAFGLGHTKVQSLRELDQLAVGHKGIDVVEVCVCLETNLKIRESFRL